MNIYRIYRRGKERQNMRKGAKRGEEMNNTGEEKRKDGRETEQEGIQKERREDVRMRRGRRSE